MESLGFPVETIVIFFVVTLLSIYFDLRAHKRSQEISITDAALWSLFWIGLALCYYGYLWVRFGEKWANLFLTGYLLEESLSVDNMMVFILIFASFSIKGALQHRILYLGILGAIVFRAIFVTAGTALFAIGPWVQLVFALIVGWSAWKMLTANNNHAEITDYSDHWSVRFVQRVFPIFPRLHGNRLFVDRAIVEQRRREDPSIHVEHEGRVYATPAFLCLMVVETSDIVFSFDSVPAVIAVTQEPLLVYSAVIFAILGLRSLYFVLAALTRYLAYLQKAVIVLLFFIAGKLTIHATNHLWDWPGFVISSDTSLTVVIGCLSVGVLASLLFPKAD